MSSEQNKIIPLPIQINQNQLTVTKPKEAFSLPSVLNDYQFYNPLPATVTVDVLQNNLDVINKSLEPSTQKHIAIAVLDIFDFCTMFGINIPKRQGDDDSAVVERLTKIYAEHLSDIPPDLLDLAIKRIIGGRKWRNLPMPADIRELVEIEITHRKTECNRYEIALARLVKDQARRQTPVVSDNDIAQETLDNEAAARREERKRRIKAVMAETIARMSVNTVAREEHAR